MFSDNSLGAYLSLQERARHQTDSYVMERIDRALDEIGNNPQRVEPGPFQVRSAMGNAAKVLKARRTQVPAVSLEAEVEAGHGGAVQVDADLDMVETLTWLLRSPGVTEIQRGLLLSLAKGHDAVSLAARHGVPVTRMRERIARARAAARRAYAAEVLHDSGRSEAQTRPAAPLVGVPA